MLRQLTIFGTVEVVGEEPRVPPPPPPADVPSALAPVDPRQCGLFDGPLAELGALEAACAELDVATARAVWQRAAGRFPDWAAGQRWPSWIDDLAWLAAAADADDALAVARARALAQTDAQDRFAGMTVGLRDRIACGALAYVARRLVAAHGPVARSKDGRPAGCLMLVAGRSGEAEALLAAAAAALPQDGAVHAYLGEARWRCGHGPEALLAYARACLVAPTEVSEGEVTCTLVLDLFDTAAELELPEPAAAWLPVLADLTGKLPLLALSGMVASSPAQATIELLRTYRRLQREDALPEARRLELKRAMLRGAPPLRELVRRL